MDKKDIDAARQRGNGRLVTCKPRKISLRYSTCARIVRRALTKTHRSHLNQCEGIMRDKKCPAIRMMIEEYQMEELIHFTPIKDMQIVKTLDEVLRDSDGIAQPRHPNNPRYMRGWECLEHQAGVEALTKSARKAEAASPKESATTRMARAVIVNDVATRAAQIINQEAAG